LQLGFVIDHGRCIGCHACTVACKSENDVPLGQFRTWVKYTESGQFPKVKRSFGVLRCNQCTDAPCMTICPVYALDKRPDGIVDLNQDICIGCKSCMQACPYDALYLNESTGTAEKCHFCAHRTEIGLAPACAVVCPTEAIIPGDFDDPQSRVSQMKATGELSARKLEAGTNPNVWYREAHDAVLDPMQTNAAGGYLWAQQQQGPELDAELFASLDEHAREEHGGARTVYDVDHQRYWGGLVSAYLTTKSIAAGLPLVVVLLLFGPMAEIGAWGSQGAILASLLVPLVFLGITAMLLVGDLKRPERFWRLLLRGNPRSWLVRGGYILSLQGALLTLLCGWLLLGEDALAASSFRVLAYLLVPLSVLTAIYTAWLFQQAKGRVLWLARGFEVALLVHALVAGAASMLFVAAFAGMGEALVGTTQWILAGMLAAQVGLGLLEPWGAPPRRRAEYERAHALLTRGPYRGRRAVSLMMASIAMLLVLVPGPYVELAAAVLALGALWIEQDTWVRAGQAPAIS
jgi:Fe-S-cluster-containing dehydrogenase component/predicted membrane protein